MLEAAIWATIIWFVLAIVGCAVIVWVSGLIGIFTGYEFSNLPTALVLGMVAAGFWAIFALFHAVDAFISIFQIALSVQ